MFDPSDMLDIGLTILFLIASGLFFFRYYRFRKSSCLALGTFFFVDSLGFTAFDVGKIGINKEIYDLIQMLLCYVIMALIVIVLALNTNKKELG